LGGIKIKEYYMKFMCVNATNQNPLFFRGDPLIEGKVYDGVLVWGLWGTTLLQGVHVFTSPGNMITETEYQVHHPSRFVRVDGIGESIQRGNILEHVGSGLYPPNVNDHRASAGENQS
jgi:hypothetical protein